MIVEINPKEINKMEFKINKPYNIPENFNHLAFLKFYDKSQYIDKLRNGQLYMRSREVFSNLDKEGMGDGDENKELIAQPTKSKKPKIEFVTIDNKFHIQLSEIEKENPKDDSYFMLHDRNSKKQKIFCLYTLWYNIETGELYKFDEEMKKRFGEFCCFIYDPCEFLKRVISESSLKLNHCKKVKIDFVKYIDTSNMTIIDWDPFKKIKARFEYQNEFRILVMSDNEDEFINYKLYDDINDISIKTTFDDLITRLNIRDGKLFIPQISD